MKTDSVAGLKQLKGQVLHQIDSLSIKGMTVVYNYINYECNLGVTDMTSVLTWRTISV